MTIFARRCIRLFLLAFGLVVGGGVTSSAAAQTDVIRGKVTDASGAPIPNVRVTATSIPGNVTRETRTDGKGAFQIVFPGGTGDYFMGYASLGYAYRQFEIKRTADQDVLIADARLAPVMLDTMRTEAVGTPQRPSRFAPPDVSGTERMIAPGSIPTELLGDIAAMAASLPGVLLIPGAEGGADGFSVFGLGADQNSTTLNGLPTSSSNLPRDASISTSLSTSPFDVSRGGFSGGNLNVRSGLGSNYKERGVSVQLNAPQAQWTDRAARALGAEYTNISISGKTAGPISLNKTFYNFAYEASRRSQFNPSLLGTSPIGLNTAGIASDSVSRLVQILGTQSVGGFDDFYRSQRQQDRGSILGSIDYSPPQSATGQTIGFTVNGQWTRQSPINGSPTQFSSASGERTDFGGGVQMRHSAYVKTILTESSAGINASKNSGEPYLNMPTGRVRVTSALQDGSTGVNTLNFGGYQGLNTNTSSVGLSAQNTLSWFDGANKHRIKLSSEFNYSGNSSEQSNNLLGTFTYNSLADLENNVPASFSRQLTTRNRSTGQVSGAVSLGDSYRKSPDTQIQYGARVDVSTFTMAPEYNPAVKAAFDGRRNDFTPVPFTISPRIGFSRTLGQSQEFEAYFGGFRAPRAVVRGGVGVFTNNPSSGLVGQALDNTGLPSGAQQLTCFGAATPIPDWSLYADNPNAVPSECANGTSGTVFSNSRPTVTMIAKNFRPQQAIRSNLSWTGAILDARFNATFEGTYALNRNQQRTVDINFQPTTGFALAAEDNRPVFVQPTSIVTATGAVSPQDARVSPNFFRVNEIRSDLKSTSAQLQVRLNPIYRTQTTFGWSGAYTYSHVREQVSGFQSTASNPLSVEWFQSGQGPHQISYNLRYVFFNAVQVSWNGQFRSGSAFTPTVASDINGDGYVNDRAFVFDPSGPGDTAVTNGMRRLLDASSGSTKECLASQLGNIATRNSCRAPWTSSASMSIAIDRAKFRLPRRAALSFSLSNPFGAADMLLHGESNLRGWGTMYNPDQTLLHVRGFDPSGGGQFRYEVNQRFGATRPQVMTLRNPVILTAMIRYDLGAPSERQLMEQRLNVGRTTPGTTMPEFSLRSMLTNSIRNPMPQILFQQDSLQLTAVQADSIASMNRRYNYRVDSLWSSTVRWFVELPKDYDSGEVWERYLRARRTQIDMLAKVGPLISDLLTSAQKRKVPASLMMYTDPRYLASIRNGSGIFVGPGQFSQGGGAGFPIGIPAGASFEMISIIR
jgi:hypothetical protein